ncbi:MAG TPA: ATP-grasp domain-containing protein [Oscillatoriaceae cyanobacterium]
MSRPTILCVASHLKGFHFIREAHRLGCHVLLLTHEKLLNEPWPRECLDDVFALPNFDDPAMVRNVVTYLGRERRIDRLVPLGDYDVEVTAQLREHLRMPGMGVTASLYFRDKLAMRQRARERGVPVPEFTGLFHYPDVAHFLQTVPGPWVLKPRMEAGSKGIQLIEHPEQLWRALDELGDQASLYLLEKFIQGELYHVDSVVKDRQVIFASAQKYGKPILALKQQGGVYSTVTLPRGSEEEQSLQALNRDVIAALGLERGVTHIEYFRDAEGRCYFLEAACRVGAAKIPDVIFYATGVCLWHEWAKLEAETPEHPYVLPVPQHDYAGVVLSVANQERPDTARYTDPEIVWRQATRKHHVGLLVKSPDPERVRALIQDYARRIPAEFCGAMV